MSEALEPESEEKEKEKEEEEGRDDRYWTDWHYDFLFQTEGKEKADEFRRKIREEYEEWERKMRESQERIEEMDRMVYEICHRDEPEDERPPRD